MPPNWASLTDPSFVSPRDATGYPTTAYRYLGYIPGFPEIEPGTATRPLWVIMELPLQSGNVWEGGSKSWRNIIEVSDRLFVGKPGIPLIGSYTIRMLFTHPFSAGPPAMGTAHEDTISGLNTRGTVGILETPSWLRGSSVAWTRAVSPPPPALPDPLHYTDVPAGWMAQTRFQFRQQAGLPFMGSSWPRARW